MTKRICVIAVAVSLMAASAVLAQSTLRCESQDGRYHECAYNSFGSIALTHQLSKNTCIEGQTWGVRNNMVWVDNGCRADFTVYQTANQRPTARATTVVCESQSRKREQCTAQTKFGVSLSRQLSRDSCIEGKSWGFTNKAIWVDNGCRAEFLVGTGYGGNLVPNANLATYATTLTCESQNNRRNYCAADTIGGVQLSRQLSDHNCVVNRDWGYDSSGVWVTNGCRAEFTVGGAYENLPQYSSYTSALKCESMNGKRNYCAADTRFGVQLGKQLSGSSCVFNRDWGYDGAGIWVRNGCRAEFYLNH